MTQQKTSNNAAPGSTEMQARLWSGAPRDWAELAAAHSIPAYQLALDLARVGRGTRVLDIGCGSGEGLVVASLRGATPTGIDLAPGLVDLARERIPQADVRTGDMQALPYKDKSFDAAIFVNTLMFPPDRVQAVREAHRVLTPGARVAVAAWAEPERCDLAQLMNAVRRLLPDAPPGEGPFVLGPDGVTAGLLRQGGFDVVTREEIELPLRMRDEDQVIHSMSATGPVQGAIQAVGERAVVRALSEAAEPFRQEDGSYRFDNIMRCVAGRKPA